jgi:hypothetical protein
MSRRCPPFLVLLSLLLILGSCGVRERSLSLPSDPPLSRGLGWALVGESYLRLLAEPVGGASESGLLRDGAVAKIEARAIGKGEGLSGPWYLLEAEEGRGWAPGTAIVLYESREQALLAKARR